MTFSRLSGLRIRDQVNGSQVLFALSLAALLAFLPSLLLPPPAFVFPSVIVSVHLEAIAMVAVGRHASN
jgi:hypothetical protein